MSSVNSDRIAAAAHLHRSSHIRIGSLTHMLLWFCVYAFPPLPQDHINLHINQQSDDKGNVEGHDGGVHHKGRVGDHTQRLITSGCGDKQRVNTGFRFYFKFYPRFLKKVSFAVILLCFFFANCWKTFYNEMRNLIWAYSWEPRVVVWFESNSFKNVTTPTFLSFTHSPPSSHPLRPP